MKALVRKELLLCLHPTAFLFLAFAVLVLAPNYPYEMIFFFSGLSVFYTSLAARENGDAAFTAALPVRKRDVPRARILVAVLFQCALLLLTAVCIAVKQAAFPEAMRVNMVGNSANLAFCGFGALALGAFNLVFFPRYYRDPNRVGGPFVAASAVQVVLIGMMVLVRHLPFAAPVASPDPAHRGVKLAVLLGGLCLYGLMTALSARLAGERFEKGDV